MNMNNLPENDKEDDEKVLTEVVIEVEVVKGDARKNIHNYIREFLIILVKIAQKHAKEKPQSELAGLGTMLIPISKIIIDAIVKEVQADPDDLNKLIEYFFKKLEKEGFFDVEEEDKEETKAAE